MYLQNLHTHSTYDDGKTPLRTTVEKGISLGFETVGFSGHSWMPFSPAYAMTPEKTIEYIKEANALKAEYADRIHIACGIELEYYSEIDLTPYEYIIGSCHYFKINGEMVGFDRSADEVKHVIDTYFQGDGLGYAKAYYELLATLPTRGKIDIIGHFDLITKHCETHAFFDLESKAYLSYAVEAMTALEGKIPYFEVNTGAIARGYRTTPYPTLTLLKELKRLGFGAVISSDCHNAEDLNCNFTQAEELLKTAGFSCVYGLTSAGFVPKKL